MKIHSQHVGREREPEHFGPYALSVQASSAHFCEPKVDGLPLSGYASFEVVLLHRSGGRNLAPSDAGLDESFDAYWNLSHPTCASAPFLPADVLERLRDALAALYPAPS